MIYNFWQSFYLFDEKITVIPCTCIKTWKQMHHKTSFQPIFFRIKVGYTVEYIDILKSYLNLNKYMGKARALWCIYFKVPGI